MALGISQRARRRRSLSAAVVIAVLGSMLVVAAPAATADPVAKAPIAWGRNTWGEATVPAGLSDVKQVSGTAHSMALRTNGTVIAWGHDKYGETAVPAGLSGVTQVAAGGFHSMALKSDGSLVIWGQNQYGQANVPAGLHDIVAISGGRYHSLALQSSGTVVAWGSNAEGQSAVPAGLDDVVAIDGGGFHSLALKGDGTVVAWGDNTYGQSTVPAGLHDVVAVAAGWYHSLALKSDGTVVAWGDNENGQATVPTNLPPVAQISAGATFNTMAFQDGTVGVWGDENPATDYGIRNVPVAITGVVQVSGKAMNSIIIADDPAPTSVTGLTASTVSSAKVTLNWAYPAQPTDHDIARIIVRAADGDTPPATVTDGVAVTTGRPLVTSATDTTGLAVGQRRSYSVFAQDLAGNVGPPATVTVPTFPGPVTNATATATGPTSVTLSWQNPGVPIKSIAVRRAVGTTAPATPTSGTKVSTPSSAVETVVNSGLTPNVTYTYAIFAMDFVGNYSPLGSGSSVTVTPGESPPPGNDDNDPAPTAVTNLAAPVVTSSKVTLNWANPAQPTDTDIARIIVRVAAGDIPPATATDGVAVPTSRPLVTTATDTTGLSAGDRYSYSVFAQDQAGHIGPAASITVPNFPGPVTDTTATAIGSTSVTLNWQNPNVPLKYLIVRRAVGSTPPATPTSGTKVTMPTTPVDTVTSSGLTPNTTYTYSVFARDVIGNTSALGPTSTITITTPGQ